MLSAQWKRTAHMQQRSLALQPMLRGSRNFFGSWLVHEPTHRATTTGTNRSNCLGKFGG
jgi:hypothetical protein